MLTRCPECRSVYRIRARDLRAARGRVRCGGCGAKFDALASLRDDDETERSPLLTERVAEVEARDAAQAPTGVAAGAGAKTVATQTAGPAEDDTVPPFGPPDGAPAQEDVALRVLLEAPRDEPPPLGLEAEAHAPRRSARLLWGAVAALLALALGAQAVWYFRDGLMARYPGTRAWLEQACSVLGCEVGARRAVQRLRLESRDVREHPRYRDALLVNATLVNRARFTQPYPLLELSLYDVGGELLARRRFRPEEYLGGTLDASAGMPPGMPVYVVLELVGGTGAAGFEIALL